VNFSLSEEQQALRDLAARIFGERVTHERLQELEASPQWYDLELWADLARTNLTGLAMPAAEGGSGLGILEICLVLQELGRHLAPVPLLPTMILGGLPIGEFGSPQQRARWLAPAARDGLVLTAALHEAGSLDPARPRTTARRDGEGWRLDGVKECVPAAQLASCVLVPASTEDGGVGVFLVDPNSAGVIVEPQLATNREPQGRISLAGASVPVDGILGDAAKGAAIVEWIVDRALVGLSAIQLGLCEEALRRTAEYTTIRKQFGQPIGSFQGVALRAADAYIDIEAMRSTLLEACWRLAAGRPAKLEVAVAKWWACRAGTRVTHTAQHLHGGIGSDVSYPIHRFFLWSKQIELTLGGAGQQLSRIGELLATGSGAQR
jgi:alkylation response protein AidB-like acyl-CoA dehydrogenase